MRTWVVVAMLVGCGSRTTERVVNRPTTTSDAAVGTIDSAPAAPKPPGTGPFTVAWTTLVTDSVISSVQDAAPLPDGGAIAGGTTGAGPKGPPKIFLRAFDPAGAQRWSFQLEVNSELAALHVLADGSVLGCGSFRGSLVQDGKALAMSTSKDRTDAIVVKLTPTGTLAWVATGGSKGTDWCEAITELDGHILIAGLIGGDAKFGRLTLKGLGARDVWIGRLDADGTWAAVQASGSDKDDTAFGIAAANGTFCITGYAAGDATIAGQTLKMPPPPNKAPTDPPIQGFVACYDSATFNPRWAVGFGGQSTIDAGKKVVVAADGEVTVLADVAGKPIITRFDAKGTEVWRKTLDGEARALTVLAAGDVLALAYAGSGTDLIRYAPDGSVVATGRIASDHPVPPNPNPAIDETHDDFELLNVAASPSGRLVVAGRIGDSARITGALFAPSTQTLRSTGGWVGILIALDPQ